MKKWLPVIGSAVLVAVLVIQFETAIEWAQLKTSGRVDLGLNVVPPEPADQVREVLQRSFFHQQIWQWLGLLLLIALGWLAGYVARLVVRRFARLANQHKEGSIGDTVRNLFGLGMGLVTGAMLAQALLPDLALRGSLAGYLDYLTQATIVLGGVMAHYAAWDAICDRLAAKATGHERVERLLVPVTRKLVQAVIIGAGILVAIGVLYGTKAITSLVATLGISGLVIALAAKDSVENVFGSLTILFDMPFALGDWVKINSVEGVVEEINLRSTRIRTFEDTVILLPNANLIRASVENYGQRRVRRQRFHLRLSYDCQPEQIDDYCTRLKDAINAHPEVVADRTLVDLNDPQEPSIGVLVQCFLEVPSFDEESRIRHEILEACLRLRGETGIVFAAAPRPAAPG